MGKILSNKQALLAILDGKIVKSPNRETYRYKNNRIEYCCNDNHWVRGNYFNVYSEFTLVEQERETITLYEHISNCGEISFLTDDKRYIIFWASCNELARVTYPHKVKKLYRDGVCQTVKAWADTLEYVQEGE